MTDAAQTETQVLDDWDAKNRAYNELAARLDEINKTDVFQALASADITAVTLDFDGYADSGQIESVIAKNGDNLVDLPKGKIEIAKAEWHWRRDQPHTRLLERSDRDHGLPLSRTLA
ncbi:DUF6878 family protein [Methylocystis sp. IM4]|uniref:DUF6878 family protein n=1 Tax=Methylocystis sp. IM4 TaxID=3136560 RepID=UPI0031196557